MSLHTQDRIFAAVPSVACSKRSDSGERCEVKIAIKSRGGLGREVLFFSRSFLLRTAPYTAPHYLNAWNRLFPLQCQVAITFIFFQNCFQVCQSSTHMHSRIWWENVIEKLTNRESWVFHQIYQQIQKRDNLGFSDVRGRSQPLRFSPARTSSDRV